MSDATVLASWGADREFCEAAEWRGELTVDQHEERWRTRIVDGWGADLIRLGADAHGTLVGYVDLHGSDVGRRELGYLVGGRERWGQGLGGAVARAGLDHAFQGLGLLEAWAEAVDANPASVRILQGLGMSETGRGEDHVYCGIPSRYRRFAITADRWHGLHRDKETP
ncbi:GNAT family N-acetyltransferase [Arsenicicoccus sp. oral taxon 190]|uniref:GNAT family N-acetyltransferase n=1 Tax=Arsenicicoccus sp. oral taxon 190 TaxID=1658671 RepID=UPI00067BB98B|nr:GNAT family protein [Arsenicicoccus sp. oral taxon 190]